MIIPIILIIAYTAIISDKEPVPVKQTSQQIRENGLANRNK